MTYLFREVPVPLKTVINDGNELNNVGAIRTSQTRLLGEYRYMYSQGSSTLMNDLIVGNGTLFNDYTRNCYLANTTTISGDRVVRQTKEYHSYITGTSNYALVSFKFDTPKANLKQMTGLFDDNNGFFFRMNGTVPELVVRKNGTDTEVIAQSNWNIDRFDGSSSSFNPSGILADWTKCHLLALDYQWMGVGRVRMGFYVNGTLYYAHYFNHSNSTTETYTTQPSLPIRWEISNNGAVTSNSQLMIMSGAVYCENFDKESGFSRSVSTNSNTVTISNSTDGTCILAVRLRNTIVNKPIQAMAKIKGWSVYADNDIRFKLVILNDRTKFSNTPVWTNVPGYGWCEYATNLAMASGWSANNDYQVLEDNYSIGFVYGNNKVTYGTGTTALSDNSNDAIYQNYNSTESQIFAIIGYQLAGTNANARASMDYFEVK